MRFFHKIYSFFIEKTFIFDIIEKTKSKVIMMTVSQVTENRIKTILSRYRYPIEIIEFPKETKTAKQAADALHCEVGQIAKSIILKALSSEKAILVIASGKNYINLEKISIEINDQIKQASPVFVFENTGYPVGGVPPIGHIQPILTFIDEDLMEYEELWASAGTTNSVFKLSSFMLEKLTGGKVINIH